MGFWDDLEAILSGKSLSRQNSMAGSERLFDEDTISLFQAVRLAIGVQPQDMDFADVAFWEWRDMRTLLINVWEALDKAATSMSNRRESAALWVHRPEQLDLNVSEFVTKGRSHAPSISSLAVTRRPEAFLMINSGKVDASVASTVAVIVQQSGIPYGEVLDQLLKVGGKDEDLLEFLDLEVNRLGADRSVCDQSPIPRELIRAKQKLREQLSLSSISVLGLLELLDASNNLTNISDDALLMRLLQLAPEENKSIARKIQSGRPAANQNS